MNDPTTQQARPGPTTVHATALWILPPSDVSALYSLSESGASLWPASPLRSACFALTRWVGQLLQTNHAAAWISFGKNIKCDKRESNTVAATEFFGCRSTARAPEFRLGHLKNYAFLS